MRRALALLALLALTVAGFYAAVALSASSPPGQDPCSHGQTGKECRPDPQPDNGRDCEHHGKQGGQNEDHCAPGETEPPTTTEPPPTTTQPPTTTAPPPTTTAPPPPPPGTTAPGVTNPSPPTTTPTTTTPVPPSVTTSSPPSPPPPVANSPQPKQPKPASPAQPKAPPAEVQRPVSPKGKTCPPNTRLFNGRCHPIAAGRG